MLSYMSVSHEYVRTYKSTKCSWCSSTWGEQRGPCSVRLEHTRGVIAETLAAAIECEDSTQADDMLRALLAQL
jgi:hypothetical protein